MDNELKKQQAINKALMNGQLELENAIDAKDKLIDELNKIHIEKDNIIRSLKKDVERLEDASDYWKEQFVQFYNAIYRIGALPAEEYTDGECLDRIFERLKQYGRQTDEQHEVNW